MMQRKNSDVRVESVRDDWKKSTLELFTEVLFVVVVLLMVLSYSPIWRIGANYFYYVILSFYTDLELSV